MRLHIELDDALLGEVDRVAGPRGRSSFIRRAVEAALRHDRQRALFAQTRGAIKGSDHDWDEDPAEWVRGQRQADGRRVG